MKKESLFCDNEELIEKSAAIISDFLLGNEASTKVKLRYQDLKANFNCVTFDEWKPGGEYSLWKFSSGLTPYGDYDDTSVVPIPISNELFKFKDAVVSYDFPVWFNMSAPASGRIMLISQDPIGRSIDWYKGCRDALCSTVFGLHNPIWRNKGNGGKRVWLLVERLVREDFGVYLTDCIKFAIQNTDSETIEPTGNQSAAYQDALKAEIAAVNPDLIVTFGCLAADTLSTFSIVNVCILHLPHFSGLAQGKIRDFFNWPNEKVFTIKEQVECYYNAIKTTIQTKH